MSLRKKAISGLYWSFIDVFVTRGVSLAAAVLMARVLSPEDFGLMGMIYIFTAVASSLVDAGMTASLIRDPNPDNKDYSTVFYMNTCVSLCLYIIIFIFAPSISNFYSQPQLVSLIRVYSLIFIINSFSGVQHAINSRMLLFKKMTVLNLPAIIIGAIIGLLFVYNGYGVWSLIYMQLSTQFLYSAFLWTRTEWKPTLLFSKTHLKKHLGFGYKLTLASLLNSVFDNAYNVIIGKFYPVQILGQFDRAKTFNNYPVKILTAMISKVTYPILASIQNDKEKLLEGYRKIMKLTFFVSVPIMLSLSIVSKPLLLFFLGNKWALAADLFKILCIAGILFPIHTFNINLLRVLGRSDLLLRNEIIKKIIAVIIIILAFPHGIHVVVWSAVLISLIELLVNTYYSGVLIKYSLKVQINDNKKTIIAGLSMYIIGWISSLILKEYSYPFQILSIGILSFFIYLVVNLTLKNETLKIIRSVYKF